jgi:hypothetical protein
MECCLPSQRPRSDLEVKDTAFLVKWLFKLLTEDGIWKTILKQKYIGPKALSQVH